MCVQPRRIMSMMSVPRHISVTPAAIVITVSTRPRRHLSASIKKGGAIVKERHCADFYATIGQQGGTTTRQRLGVEHFERIGRLGGLRARKREQQQQEQEE